MHYVLCKLQTNNAHNVFLHNEGNVSLEESTTDHVLKLTYSLVNYWLIDSLHYCLHRPASCFSFDSS